MSRKISRKQASRKISRKQSHQKRKPTYKPKLCSFANAPKQYDRSICDDGVCDIPTRVMTGLYLGSACSRHPAILDRYKIKIVITANKESKIYTDKNRKYVKYNLRDISTQSLQSALKSSYKIIHDAIKNGERVLVHCAMGISRSASIVIYYVMKSKNTSYDKALLFVRNKRKIVNPNSGFERQLRSLSK